MTTKSDDELFEMLREGDKTALSELFSRYYDYLIHYGCQITTRVSLVEECIQEMFLYIFESHTRLGRVKNVKAYLFSSFRRRLIDRGKKEWKRRSAEEDISPSTDINFLEEDILLEEEQMRKSLIEAINQLPWQQREAIYLRYYNKLSTREIAEVMGIANQTVLNTLYIALKKIRKNFTLKELMGFLFPLAWILLCCN